MKARFCAECKHFNVDLLGDAYCIKKYTLRFYPPKSPIDTNWGYKRRCWSYKENPDVPKVSTPA